MFERPLLTLIQLEDLRNDQHEYGDDDGAPEGGEHDDELSGVGLGSKVTETNSRDRHNNEVDKVVEDALL